MKAIVRSTLLIAVIAVSSLGLPATSSGATARMVQATPTNEWKPRFLRIGQGERVVWQNPTANHHDVTSYGRNWRKRTHLHPGGQTSKRFKRLGTFKYYCSIHGEVRKGKCSGMCGRIQTADV